MSVTSSEYGSTQSGDSVILFSCVNRNGCEAKFIDYGATLVAVLVPDREGQFANVVLGCDDIAGYEACTAYFGSTVGRVCNRIAGGKFTIDGNEFTLATNDGPNHLHGGKIGFDKKIWQAEPIEEPQAVGVRFTLVSDAGDEGYPGRLSVIAEYRLTNEDELIVDFRAETDAATHVNLTDHSYWNLGGVTDGCASTVYDHEVFLNADRYLVSDADSIPTGVLADVGSTPFDFRCPKLIGQDLRSLANEPIGYDHCYVLNQGTNGDALAAVVTEHCSGRRLEVLTNQPSVQFYTGNYLDGERASGGFSQHSAFCIEAQGYVNAANQADFPSTLLRPGEAYRHTTVHRFSVVQPSA